MDRQGSWLSRARRNLETVSAQHFHELCHHGLVILLQRPHVFAAGTGTNEKHPLLGFCCSDEKTHALTAMPSAPAMSSFVYMSM